MYKNVLQNINGVVIKYKVHVLFLVDKETRFIEDPVSLVSMKLIFLIVLDYPAAQR